VKCLIATPYEVDSQSGNSVSARRIANLLKSSELDTHVITSSDLERVQGDVLIALHARKSAAAVKTFHARYPEGKIIVFLTGTDLYEDIPSGCYQAEETIQLADRLIVSQEASLQSVPSSVLAKTRVVHKSLVLPDQIDPYPRVRNDEEVFRVSIVGHMRAVKRPLDLMESIALKPELHVLVRLIGGSYDDRFTVEARKWETVDNRFLWLGELSRLETLERVKGSQLTVNSSESEGGANSVGESIMLGVPVLASRIEGNIGMLGENYAGYFPCGDTKALADLLEKAVHDSDFYAELVRQTIAQQPRFDANLELKGWLEAISVEI